MEFRKSFLFEKNRIQRAYDWEWKSYAKERVAKFVKVNKKTCKDKRAKEKIKGPKKTNWAVGKTNHKCKNNYVFINRNIIFTLKKSLS